MPNIRPYDFMFMFWCKKPMPVFLNKTFMTGLLETYVNDPTQGFNRQILLNNLKTN